MISGIFERVLLILRFSRSAINSNAHPLSKTTQTRIPKPGHESPSPRNKTSLNKRNVNNNPDLSEIRVSQKILWFNYQFSIKTIRNWISRISGGVFPSFQSLKCQVGLFQHVPTHPQLGFPEKKKTPPAPLAVFIFQGSWRAGAVLPPLARR